MDTLGQIAAVIPPAGLLCAALVLDALLPDTPGLPRPGKIAAGFAAAFARRLDRPDRTLRTRRMRGVLVLFLIAGFAGAAAWVIADLAGRVPPLRILEVLVLIWLMGVRRTWSQLRAAARNAPDDPARDPHRVRRDAIEAAARGFLDHVAGPAVWYLAMGLPGAVVYAVAAGPVGRTPLQKPLERDGFAMAFQRLHILMGWVPAWIAAALIALAAVLTPRARLRNALREIAAHVRRPMTGAPAAAMAGALDLALAGPAPGEAARPWLGRGRARATGTDISRAAYVYAVACLLMLTGSAVLAQFSLTA